MATNSHTQLISVAHTNAHSLSCHFTDIQTIVLDKGIHVLGVSESWLKPKDHSSSVSIPNYHLLRNDRVGKGGGGVALYVHDSIKSRIIDCSPHVYRRLPEFLMVELLTNSAKILCIVVYNPPKAGYWCGVEDALLNYNSTYDFAMLLGDLNINWDAITTPGKILRGSFTTCGLHPLGFGPTHHRATAHTKIDYICVTNQSKVDSFSQENFPAISEHDFLFTTLKFSVTQLPPRSITRRSFRNFDPEAFDADLKGSGWGAVIDAPDVDTKVQIFNALFVSLFDKHAPYRTFRVKNRPSPWMTPALKALIRERNKAGKKLSKSKRKSDEDVFKALRNKVKIQIRNTKAAYYREKLSNCSDRREMWQIIDEISYAPNLGWRSQ